MITHLAVCALALALAAAEASPAPAAAAPAVAAPREPPAPRFGGVVDELRRTATLGDPFELSVEATGAEGRRLEITADRLPAGAVLRVGPPSARTPRRDEGTGPLTARQAAVRWTPGPTQRGVHRFALTVSDGERASTIDAEVSVQEHWESAWLPGLLWTTWSRSDRSLGRVQGPTVEVVVFGWVHQTEKKGPSHGRVYVDLSLLSSDKPGVAKGAAWAIGADLSLERNPRRSFLVPFFGAEAGGFRQRDVGTILNAVPFGGVYLWTSENLFVHAKAGYVFPRTEVERFGGWQLKAGFDLALW
jgi:hypothetical protein